MVLNYHTAGNIGGNSDLNLVVRYEIYVNLADIFNLAVVGQTAKPQKLILCQIFRLYYYGTGILFGAELLR